LVSRLSFLLSRRLFREKCRDLFGAGLLAEETALTELAPPPKQLRDLVFVFDPVGDSAKMHRLAEGDDDLRERRLAAVLGHSAHERRVDLEDVDRNSGEVAERGVPRAEFVDRQANAERLQ